MDENMNYIQKYRRILDRKQIATGIVLLLLMFIQGFLETVSVSLIIPIMSIVMSPSDVLNNKLLKFVYESMRLNSMNEFLIVILFATIVCYILKNVFLVNVYRFQYKYVYNNQLKISKKIMENYLFRPYEYYLNASTADINRVLNGDVGSTFSLLIILFQLLSEAIVAVFLVILLMSIDAEITIALGGVLLLTLFLNNIILKKKLNHLGEKAIQYSAKSSRSLWQPINGIKEVKITRKEEYFIHVYEENARNANDATIKSNIMTQVPRLLIEVIMIGGMLSLIIIFLLSGRSISTMIQQLSAFALAAVRLMPSANRMNTYINQIAFYEPSLDVVIRELNDCTSHKYQDEIESEVTFSREILLQNISFHYPASESYVLENVDLKIPVGHSIGLVGHSGSGKSTAVDIILGLLKPQTGKVLIDGINIEKAYNTWLSKVGYIPQMIYMLDDTIRKNVAFGEEETEIQDEKIWEALKDAQLLGFVKGLPKGLDTKIGERGVRLSGGQRQRIGIARALYNQPDILIFDEATSALDNETEAAVMEAIDFLKGKKTMIIIAHRLETIRNCDIVYRVEKGKIVETTI